jgi:uncharacterized membrane protein YkvA (DUF1232 family)
MLIIKEFFILLITVAALVYLFLPSLLPDIVPLVGWIDEGVATTIVLSALKHWGFDLTGLFGDGKAKQMPASQNEDVIVTDTSGQQTRKIRIPREVLERALQDYQQEQYSRR